VEVVLIEEGLRAAGGRTTGVRGLPEYSEGRVLERAMPELGGVDMVDLNLAR